MKRFDFNDDDYFDEENMEDLDYNDEGEEFNFDKWIEEEVEKAQIGVDIWW